MTAFLYRRQRKHEFLDMKLPIPNVDMKSDVDQHDVFQSLWKEPNSALLGALIRREQQKQTKDVHSEEIFVELENIWEWTTREI
jgi:hypothetical protein